jgi:putative hydrolase of the HAD superfamily
LKLKYRHLFFDLDNTLYDFDFNAQNALKEAFMRLGLLRQLPSFDEYFKVYSEINDELWALYREQKMPREQLRALRFERSLSFFKVKPKVDYIKIDDLYLSIMALQTNLFPETCEVLSALKKRGYKMHIITNGFKEVQTDKLVNTGLDQYITHVFISEVIQAPKPSPVIFEYAIKSSNARKKESLMIGDSWESDIIGAKQAGIDQVFFNPKKLEPDFAAYGPATYTISSLKEILDIL